MSRLPGPQLKRIDTVEPEITYRFPEEDAIGYPGLMPQARKIGLGRRSLTGMLTAAKKTEGLGPFESSLERDYFLLLEFDKQVLAWHPQPFKVPYPAENGFRKGKYTPDVAVEYTSIDHGAYLDRVELCEIKYRDDLRANWVSLKTRLRACVRFARREGWKFKLITETEIRTPLLENAKFFLPYRDRDPDLECMDRLENVLSSEGISTPNQLLSSDKLKDLQRGRMMAVLWHMIANGKVDADFKHEVTMISPIRMNANA